MNTKKLAWILAGSSAVAGAVLGLAACSGDDTKPITTKDSGTDSTTGTDAAKDTSTNDSSNPDTSTGDGGVCFDKLRPNPEAGPFCPFVAKPDGGVGVNCATGETCCYGAPKGGDAGFDLSVCKSGGAAACPAPTNPTARADIAECTEKDDCTGNQICCIVPLDIDGGTTATLSTGIDSKTTCVYAKGEKGTRCQASCGAGEWQGCQSDSECGSKKCTLIGVLAGDNLQMGYCK
jgi:hypothetical protein